MTQQLHDHRFEHHSQQWHSSSPLPGGGRIVRAMVGQDMLHAQLGINGRPLDIFRGDEFVRQVTDHAPAKTVMAHQAILSAAREIPFLLAQLPAETNRQPHSDALIYTPLHAQSSTILETSPTSPYRALRHHREIQIGELQVNGDGELIIDNFNIENALTLHAVRALGSGALRICPLPERNYMHAKRVDTSPGVSVRALRAH